MGDRIARFAALDPPTEAYWLRVAAAYGKAIYSPAEHGCAGGWERDEIPIEWVERLITERGRSGPRPRWLFVLDDDIRSAWALEQQLRRADECPETTEELPPRDAAADAAWQVLAEGLRNSMDDEDWRVWISPLYAAGRDGARWVIVTPNPHFDHALRASYGAFLAPLPVVLWRDLVEVAP